MILAVGASGRECDSPSFLESLSVEKFLDICGSHRLFCPLLLHLPALSALVNCDGAFMKFRPHHVCLSACSSICLQSLTNSDGACTGLLSFGFGGSVEIDWL
jgi:hypothetical protein